LMAEVFASRPRLHWIDQLNEAGVLCGPLNNYADLLRDPQVQFLDLVPEVSHKAFGKVPLPRFPGAEPVAEDLRPAPDMGEHTYEVLREAGYDEERITSLMHSKTCIQAQASNNN